MSGQQRFVRQPRYTPRTGDWGWIALSANALLTAAFLHRRELDLLTDSARRHKTIWVALCALWLGHVFDVLGPVDPFRALARCAPTRSEGAPGASVARHPRRPGTRTRRVAPRPATLTSVGVRSMRCHALRP